MVFFDKFCPDLHDLPGVGDGDNCATSGSSTTSGTTSDRDRGGTAAAAAGAAAYGAPAAAAVAATAVSNAPLSGTGDAEHASPVRGAAFSSSSSFSSLVAACRWCGVELGNSSVAILSDDNDENNDNGDGNADEEGFNDDGQAAGGVGMKEGDGGVPVLSLHGFLRRFADESGAEDLAKRGDLLRKVHLSSNVSGAIVLFDNWLSCLVLRNLLVLACWYYVQLQQKFRDAPGMVLEVLGLLTVILLVRV